MVCCNLRVSCLGSSNKFHSYIDVVTHVGDHFGKIVQDDFQVALLNERQAPRTGTNKWGNK